MTTIDIAELTVAEQLMLMEKLSGDARERIRAQIKAG